MTNHIFHALTNSCDKQMKAARLSATTTKLALQIQALDQAEQEAHRFLEHVRRARWALNTGWSS